MSDVQLILREDVMNLGEAGDLVRVKPGYARNFLVPQGKADFATESNIKRLEHQKRVISEKLAKELKAATDELAEVSARACIVVAVQWDTRPFALSPSRLPVAP